MFAKQDGSIAWHYSAILNTPRERSTAGKKFSDLLAHGLFGYEELITALVEWAAGRDEFGESHRAIGFTEKVARAYVALIRERVRDEHKAIEQQAPPQVRGRMRSLADILSRQVSAVAPIVPSRSDANR